MILSPARPGLNLDHVSLGNSEEEDLCYGADSMANI